MKELQVSLYDVFGYVAPGVIAFLGIYLLGWRLVLPSDVDWSMVSTGGWIVILLVSYILGHAVQALANLFVKLLIKVSPETTELADIEKNSPEVFASFVKSACRVTKLPDGTSPTHRVLYEIADAYLTQHGKTECRDIYIYREGFYRGLTVSLLLLSIGAFARMTGADATINIFGTSVWLHSGFFGILALVAVGISFLSFNRFQRFSSYRVRNSVFGFLTVANPKTD